MPISPSWTTPTKRVVAVALVVIAVFVLYLARGILTPLVLGALLALVLTPLIDALRRHLRLPRGLAVAVAYLLLFAVLVAGPILFVPALVRSVAALDVPVIAERISDWAIGVLVSLRDLEVLGGSVDLGPTVDPLIDRLEEGGAGLDIDLMPVFAGAWAVFGGILGFLGTALLSLVISVYLAATGPDARSGIYSLVPDAHEPEIRVLGARMGRVWTDYLRGQLTVALLLAVLTTVTLFALGVPGALALGVIGGFLNIIPTFGPIAAGVIAGLVALVQGSTRFDIGNGVFALIVVGAYVVIQQIESNLVTPRIVGEAVDVPPLGVLIGILVGFGAAGVVGAVVAVPVVASGREVLRYVLAKLADRHPFPEGPPPRRPTATQRVRRWWVVTTTRGRPGDREVAVTEVQVGDGGE